MYRVFGKIKEKMKLLKDSDFSDLWKCLSCPYLNVGWCTQCINNCISQVGALQALLKIKNTSVEIQVQLHFLTKYESWCRKRTEFEVNQMEQEHKSTRYQSSILNVLMRKKNKTVQLFRYFIINTI